MKKILGKSVAASMGNAVAGSPNATKVASFHLDFLNDQMKSLLYVRDASGSVDHSLVSVTACTFAFDSQVLVTSLTQSLEQAFPLLKELDVVCVPKANDAWVFVGHTGDDGFRSCLGVKVHLSKFGQVINLQCSDALQLGMSSAISLFDVVSALKYLVASLLPLKAKIGLLEVSLPVEPLIDLSLRSIWPSETDYLHEFVLSEAVNLSCSSESSERRSLELTINHGSFENRVFERKFGSIANAPPGGTVATQLRDALAVAVKADEYTPTVVKYGALIGLALPSDVLDQARASDDFALLFTSKLASVKPLKADEAPNVLDAVGDVVVRLEQDGLDLDAIRPLHDSLALAFSFAWEPMDRSKALLALLKLVEASRFGPIVAQRIIDLITGFAERSDRDLWIRRFSAVPQTSPSGVTLKLFFARVVGEEDPQHSRKLTLESLRSHETDVGILLYAAENLIYLQLWQDAFGLLARAEDVLSLSVEERSLVQLKLAEIYLAGFSKPEMALDLLQQVRKVLPSDLHALRMMQHIYRDLGKSEDLATTLDEEIKILSQSNDETSSLKRLSTELSALYTSDLKDLGKAFAVYLSSPNHVEIDPEQMVQSMSLDKSKVDWRKLYKDLASTFDALESNEQRAKLHVCLALICRDKLGRAKDAVKHLIDAVQVGWIDPLSFNYLKESLASSRRHQELSQIIMLRIDRSRGDKRMSLIKELLALPIKVSDKVADGFALEVLVEDGDEKELVKRLDLYVEEENFSRLTDLLRQVYAASCTQKSKQLLTEVVIESLRSVKDDRRFKVLETAYLRKMDFDHDVIVTAQDALKDLAGFSEKMALKPFINALVERHVFPQVEPDLIEHVFAGDTRILGHYYELCAVNEANKANAASWVEKAVAIFETDESFRSDLERCYLRLCRLKVVHIDVIERLRRLMKPSKKWVDFAHALEEQVKQVDDKDALQRLYEDLIEVNRQHLNDVPAVIKWYRAALEVTEEVKQVRYDLITYLIDEMLAGEELKELRQFLSDETCIKDTVKTSVVVDRLVSTYQETGFVTETLHSWIRALQGKANFDSAGSLADILIQRGFGSPELLRVSFGGAIARNDEALAVDRLVGIFNGFGDVKDTSRQLEPIRTLIKLTNSELSFDDFMANVGYRFTDLTCPEPVSFDLLALMICSMCKRDEHAKQAMQLLDLLPDQVLATDERLWIPAYLLLRDFGEQSRLARHLKIIVPLLRINRKPIGSYPFTVESLDAELKRLNELGPSSAVAPAASLAPQEPIAHKQTGKVTSEQIAFNRPAEETRERSVGAQAPQSGLLAKEWRGLVAVNEVMPRQAWQLCQEQFGSQLEKHVAMQAFALLSREVSILNDWPWKVWRYPEQLGYAFDGRERYPQDFSSKGLYSKLHRFLMSISKNLVAYYKPKFRTASLLDDLRLTEDQFKGRVKRLGWDSFVVRSGNLIHIVDILQKRRIQLFDLRGLKSRIFFAGQSRGLYIDAEHYKSQPQTHLFHRLYGVLWAAKLNYLPLLQLDAETDLLPFLRRLTELCDDQPLAKAKSLLKSAIDQRETILSEMVTDDLRKQLKDIGEIKLETLVQLKTEMNRHIHRLLLAETLDLFGLCEAVTDKDLLIEEYDPKELVASSEDVKRLLDFAILLKLP